LYRDVERKIGFAIYSLDYIGAVRESLENLERLLGE